MMSMEFDLSCSAIETNSTDMSALSVHNSAGACTHVDVLCCVGCSSAVWMLGGTGLRVGFEKFNQLHVQEDFPIFSFMIHLFSS